ncbi:hypothetical protein PF001_g24888 [Phytophthora fragariae]|nr:hypothetical protein PF001_g24888 [Phytophthora fragariae]
MRPARAVYTTARSVRATGRAIRATCASATRATSASTAPRSAVRWGRRGWLLRGRRTTRTTVECSNKGVCDYEEGACTCDEGFVGSACQRLEYPHACNGAGQCLSLKELSATYAVGSEPLYDNVWDAEMVYGCKCSKGYHDYDCSLRSCPRGDDPLTTGQKNEVQIVQCTATGRSFFFFFSGQGAQVPFDATLSQFQSILATIPNFPQVKVSFGGTANTVCSSATDNAILIEFIYDFGPQPPIKVMGSLKGVAYLTGGSVFAASAGGILAGRTSVQGTKEWEFCSNRGDCNYATDMAIRERLATVVVPTTRICTAGLCWPV